MLGFLLCLPGNPLQPDELFTQFEEVPLGTASLAQVHKARLRTTPITPEEKAARADGTGAGAGAVPIRLLPRPPEVEEQEEEEEKEVGGGGGKGANLYYKAFFL